MTSFLSNLIVVTLLVGLSANYGSCLRCYECNNFDNSIDDDSYCNNVDSSMITRCPDSDEDTVCRILKGERRLYDGDSYSVIKRSCGKLQFESVKDLGSRDGKKAVFKDGVAVTSTICNTDLCNGAVDLSATKMLVFISVLLSVPLFTCVY